MHVSHIRRIQVFDTHNCFKFIKIIEIPVGAGDAGAGGEGVVENNLSNFKFIC